MVWEGVSDTVTVKSVKRVLSLATQIDDEVVRAMSLLVKEERRKSEHLIGSSKDEEHKLKLEFEVSVIVQHHMPIFCQLNRITYNGNSCTNPSNIR